MVDDSGRKKKAEEKRKESQSRKLLCYVTGCALVFGGMDTININIISPASSWESLFPCMRPCKGSYNIIQRIFCIRSMLFTE